MLIGVHIDPDTAVKEMEALVDVHAAVERLWKTGDILIMGDLNADCRYASKRARERLTLRTDSRFRWLIGDDVDTTTTNSDCTYDRCVRSLVTYLYYLLVRRVSVWPRLIVIIIIVIIHHHHRC